MKKIEAVIQPFELKDIKSTHVVPGVHEMAVVEVGGLGCQNAGRKQAIYPGSKHALDFFENGRLVCQSQADISRLCRRRYPNPSRLEIKWTEEAHS